LILEQLQTITEERDKMLSQWEQEVMFSSCTSIE
jgi:hypothetical protein